MDRASPVTRTSCTSGSGDRSSSGRCGARRRQSRRFCRYFELAEGVEHLDAPILNPRGDLGYMGFNTFRGDNRTFAVIVLAPAADHELRGLRREPAWRAACSAIAPLDVMTSTDYAR